MFIVYNQQNTNFKRHARSQEAIENQYNQAELLNTVK